jgi:hypothetical protein
MTQPVAALITLVATANTHGDGACTTGAATALPLW